MSLLLSKKESSRSSIVSPPSRLATIQVRMAVKLYLRFASYSLSNDRDKCLRRRDKYDTCCSLKRSSSFILFKRSSEYSGTMVVRSVGAEHDFQEGEENENARR